MNKKNKLTSEYRKCVYGLGDDLALFHFFYQNKFNDMCCVLEDVETGIIHSFILNIGIRFLDTEKYINE